MTSWNRSSCSGPRSPVRRRSHAPVDDDDLAVVEMAEVVEPPVDPSLAEQAVEVEEAALVGDDLHAALATSVAVQSSFDPRPGWL